MRGLVWYGKEDIRCETVPDPNVEEPRAAIVKVTSAICGSDLYLNDTFMVGIENPDLMASPTSSAHPKLSKESKVRSRHRKTTAIAADCRVLPNE